MTDYIDDSGVVGPKADKPPVRPKMMAVESDRLELLDECARYIIEFEQSDFEDQVYSNEECDLGNHVFAKAFTAIYGDKAFIEYLAGLRR